MLAHPQNHEYDGEDHKYSATEQNTVQILDNCIYSSKVLQVNFTSYDICREQDSMNPQTNCNVMVLSPESGEDVHPFWYAQVLGVFHGWVLHTDPAAANKSVHKIEFLWVHWLRLIPDRCFGFRQARLPKVGFLPHTDSLMFGFLDHSLVLWGCHLIPAFADRKTSDLLPVMCSATRSPNEHEVAFYVMMYVFLLLLYLLYTH